MLRIPAVSTQYVKVPVYATVAGNTNYDPTVDTVQMAFLSSEAAQPAAGDWKAASWETTTAPPTVHYARCLIGPAGTVTLNPGIYTVWVQVTDSPEVPALPVGTIQVW